MFLTVTIVILFLYTVILIVVFMGWCTLLPKMCHPRRNIPLCHIASPRRHTAYTDFESLPSSRWVTLCGLQGRVKSPPLRTEGCPPRVPRVKSDRDALWGRRIRPPRPCFVLTASRRSKEPSSCAKHLFAFCYSQRLSSGNPSTCCTGDSPSRATRTGRWDR